MPWDIKRDQRCPASKPFGVVKRADNELEGCHPSRDKAGRQLAALNAAENKQVSPEGLPINNFGWTATETLVAVMSSGKIPKDTANYVEQSPSPDTVCGSCRFYLRSPESEIGGCQVVSGPITWSATSDLYISAEEEARVSFAMENAYTGDEEEDKGMPEETEVKETEEKAHLIGMEGRSVPISVTSFDDLETMVQAEEMTDEMKGLTHSFAEMAENIFINDEVEDKATALDTLAGEFASRVGTVSENKEKWQPFTDYVENVVQDVLHKQAPMKTEGGVRYPAKDYAYTPDKEKPSTWKLRMSQGRPGNITISQLGRAAAAFSSGGFRGRRVQIPSNAVAGVKSKIRSEYTKLNVSREDMPDSVKEAGFTIWKEKDGSYRWLAVFSNNYRDNDNPPEILAGEAHQDFVKAVDNNEWPMPELWHWHVPGTRWGVADWLAYEGNFALASGSVDKGHEVEAEAVMAMPNILVSHGMPNKEIERDDKDETILTRYRSIEISDLPGTAAANLLTGFSVIDKEANMPLPEDKKQYLQDAGLSDEQIMQVEAGLKDKKETADNAGLESKEETPTQETPTVEPVSDTTPVTRGEMEEFARTVGEGLQAVMTEIGNLAGDVKEIKDKEASLSLSDVFKSAVGHDQAKVDGRTSIAKAGPKQTEPETGENEVLASGNLLANDIIGGIVTGSAWQDFPGVQQ